MSLSDAEWSRAEFTMEVTPLRGRALWLLAHLPLLLLYAFFPLSLSPPERMLRRRTFYVNLAIRHNEAAACVWTAGRPDSPMPDDAKTYAASDTGVALVEQHGVRPGEAQRMVRLVSEEWKP